MRRFWPLAAISRGRRRLLGPASLVVLVLLAVGLSAQQIGRFEAERSAEQLGVRLLSRSQSNAAILSRELEACRRDVLFLASVPPVAGIVRASGDGGVDRLENTAGALWERRLLSIFSAYAAANPAILQLRLIGMDRHGRELIRVDQSHGVRTAVPAKDLQEKGGSAYLLASAALPAGATYLSDFNLNREHGQVQQPHQPTLRAATPVRRADGSVFGVVVVNYDADALLAPLRANLPPELSAYLLNGDGDFLLHPDAAQTYGFDLGRRQRWQDAFIQLGQAGPSAVVAPRAGAAAGRLQAATSVVVLDPLRAERNLRYVLAASDAQVAQARLGAQRNALAAIGATILLMGAGGALVLRQRRRVVDYQAQMSAIVENSHDAIISKSLDGTVQSWNRGAELMFGYRAAEALGRPLVELVVPADAVAEEQDILRTIGRGERVADLLTTRRRKDGSLLKVLVTSTPIVAADGRVTGAAKTVRDVSDQVEADRRIHELNRALAEQVRVRTREVESVTMLKQAILAHASYTIIATDTQGVIRLFNPAAERMLGYGAEEVIGKCTPALWHDGAEVAARAAALSLELGREIAPGFEVFVARARDGGGDDNEWTYVRKDGGRFPVQLSVTALRDEDGGVNGYLGIASDISLRQHDQQRLVSARDQLLNAAEVAGLGIWVLTLHDNQLEWNERMYDLYEVPAARRGGAIDYADWHACVHPDDVGGTEASLRAAIAGAGKYDPVFRVRTASGQWRHIQAAASVERDARGRAVRVLGINRDITVQHEAEETLRQAKLAADAASRAKSEFLANMSHEIRSPMNAVLGMLMLLKQTELGARQLDYATKAEGAGRALLGILNDILDFSRVEAGKLTLDPQPCGIDQLMRDVGVILSANVGGKDLEILYQLDPALPEWVELDAMRLQQVLINLGGNAIKFTERGEVAIAVRPLPPRPGDAPGADVMRLGFAIRDTGIGIPAAQCAHIFEGFTQAEASTARRFGGSGLGLAISQRLVGLMGGTLAVDSVEGEGSVFSFDLVCRRLALPPRQRFDAGKLRGLRCLVIDDHVAARESMIGMLGTFGWQVDAVAGGAEAVALVQRGAMFDVVFVDWHMPGMDGWQTCVQLRALLPEHSTTLIVMVTAHGREAMTRRHGAEDLKLDGFVVKPATTSMLFDAVADGAAIAGFAPRAAGVGRGQRRLLGMRLLLAEDNATNQQVARELLGHEGALVSVADDGLAAIDAVRRASPQFDCVLMDIQMPGMDGYSAARVIRGELGLRALPIIAMTANAMESDRVLALEAGMNDHVGKPFELDQLIEVILRRSGRDGAASPPGAAPAPVPAAAAGLARAGFDGDAALRRFGGNALFYRRALRHFAMEAPRLVGQLPAEVEPDGVGPGPLLHNIRGLAATVGAQALADGAAALEALLKAPPQALATGWRHAHAQLLRAGEQAVASAVELANQLDVPARPEGATAGVADLPAELQRLRGLLETSDLEALPLFEALMRDFGGAMAAEFSDLNGAIEQFNFAVAVRHCDAMLHQLDAKRG